MSDPASRPAIPDFELVRIVGRGSYGDVWLARSVTGAWRAIKIVWRDRFANAEPFEREFRGLKEFADVCLGESSQMTLLHVGRNDAAGFFYYVMELADDADRGRDIDPVSYVPLTLAELRTRRGRIPADECARFGAEVARGLASLHRRGLVHRDVKPSNIILVSGVPKLADVGLVAPSASARTFVGTEGYVPPEGPGAPSADVFALGKVLYELSTGHDRQEFPKLPADLARLPDRAALLELNEILLRSCGPTSAPRYRDGAAILADLTALNAGVSLRTRRFVAFASRITAVITVMGALGWGGWYWKTRPARLPSSMLVAAGVSPYSVALLPLVNATHDPDRDYFSDGISDEILHALERERELRVTGSRASFWTKSQDSSKVEIARALGVAQLVEGSLQRVGTRIRIDVRHTRGIDGVGESIGTFEREWRDVFALEDDVARAVAQKILPRDNLPVLRRTTTNLEAYDEFLRGRVLQLGPLAKASDAVTHFKRSVTLDPNFAVAWARLADALRMDGQWKAENASARLTDMGRMNSLTWPEEARHAVEQALKLQPDLPLAWTVSGFVHGFGDRDTAEGQRDLFRAEELGGPNAETRMTRFLVTWFSGESQGIRPFVRDAMLSNPENIERMSAIPLALWYVGDYAEADRLYARSRNLIARILLRQSWRGTAAALQLAAQAAASDFGVFQMRVRMLAELGRVEEATQLLATSTAPVYWRAYAALGLTDHARKLAEVQLPTIREIVDQLGEIARTTYLEPIRRDRALAELIAIEIQLGHHEEALALLDEWWRDAQQRKPNRRSGGDAIIAVPLFYAMLGRHDDVIAVLNQFLADGRTLGYELRDSPGYASIQKDPRFVKLRQRVEAWAAALPDPPAEPSLSVQR